ncbi:MAG: FtsQ-type POTRA domain-containing protein [Gemmatimonadetes bacterium]|jgi:cell division septal protein FtsQ|nr:FtsQ-type POTRA domain-containing protein [Gemmatimonadota bacterium]MBT6148437.1 FtsQ-type POTRA domain-containing protein [Gemmatimonadota bacterium]MBT7859694.1 FtsQ-type POTRA domain-containing protein [Gemmatimonadota bacterium]
MAQRKRQSLTSTSPATPRRRRILIGICLTILVGGLAGGAALAKSALGEASGYRLVALEVHGLRLLTGEEILEASGLRPGDSIFSADLDEVAQRIGDLVWVEMARVERRPPDRLVVTLQERRRTAWLDWQGDLFGLDASGVILPRGRLTTEGVGDLDLPVIRPHDGQTVSVDETEEGTEPWSPMVGESLPASHEVRSLLGWWLRVRTQAPGLVPEVSEILPLDEESLQLRLVADDLEVRLPLADDECLRALLGVLQRVYHDVPDAVYVDLRYRGQAVVGTSKTTLPVRSPLPARMREVSSHG